MTAGAIVAGIGGLHGRKMRASIIPGAGRPFEEMKFKLPNDDEPEIEEEKEQVHSELQKHIEEIPAVKEKPKILSAEETVNREVELAERKDKAADIIKSVVPKDEPAPEEKQLNDVKETILPRDNTSFSVKYMKIGQNRPETTHNTPSIP